MIERTLWYQEGLDDPEDPSNQGPPFKTSYNFGHQYHRPDRKLCYPGDDEANLVSSFTRDGKHAPVLDIDVPIRVVPSKTPGHSHIYIDVELDLHQYMYLLEALSFAGILEPNFYAASRDAGMSFVRLHPENRPERKAT